jgi:4-carboxymuconolactone decarboxylase
MATMSDDEKPRSERFERGLKTRREVLGPDYVERSLEQADAFTWTMQELTTEWCWDGTWNRPGLDRRSRSLLNLGMLAGLNRPHELKIHIRGALNNGMTKDELREVFVQVGTYCGVPAAMDCFRIAKDVFKEMGI